MKMATKQAALLLQTSGKDIDSYKPTYIDNFLLALADDLNTSNALMELYNVVKQINAEVRQKEKDLDKLGNLFKTLLDMFYVLGLDIKYVKLTEEDKKLYQNYIISKENKDFESSDKYRNLLIERGIMWYGGRNKSHLWEEPG